jgi:hypothetical protein
MPTAVLRISQDLKSDSPASAVIWPTANARLRSVCLNQKVSFPQTVGPLSRHFQAVQTFACGDVKRTLARSGKCHVRGLARQMDCAEVFS